MHFNSDIADNSRAEETIAEHSRASIQRGSHDGSQVSKYLSCRDYQNNSKLKGRRIAAREPDTFSAMDPETGTALMIGRLVPAAGVAAPTAPAVAAPAAPVVAAPAAPAVAAAFAWTIETAGLVAVEVLPGATTFVSVTVA